MPVLRIRILVALPRERFVSHVRGLSQPAIPYPWVTMLGHVHGSPSAVIGILIKHAKRQRFQIMSLASVLLQISLYRIVE